MLTDELIERLGLTSVAQERVDRLSTGTQRLVEMARALATKPRVVLLDEPSSGLNEVGDRRLLRAADRARGSGLAILLVEHDMGLVMSACHHIHVLDFGQIIAYGTPAEVQAEPARARGRTSARATKPKRCPRSSRPSCAEVSALQEEVRAETEHDTNGAAPVHLGVGARAGHARRCPRPAPRIELIDVSAAYGIDRRAARREHHDPAAARSTRCSDPTARARPPRSRSRAVGSTRPRGEVRFLGDRINGRVPTDKAPRRAVHHPRGPRHLPEPHRAREPPHDDLQRDVVVDRSRSAGVHALPTVEGAP